MSGHAWGAQQVLRVRVFIHVLCCTLLCGNLPHCQVVCMHSACLHACGRLAEHALPY